MSGPRDRYAATRRPGKAQDDSVRPRRANRITQRQTQLYSALRLARWLREVGETLAPFAWHYERNTWTWNDDG